MKPLFLSLLLTCVLSSIGQNNIVHFSVWNPKPGQSSLFEDGYHHHLQWHAANKDSWSWFGWYVVSGPRDGQFIDATFGHSWADFDHSVNPGGDGADNALHTEPFADFEKSYKAVRLPFSDTEDTVLLTSTFVRMLTIEVNDHAGASQLIKQLLADFRQKGLVGRALVYEVVDGGVVGQVVLLLGGSSFQDLGKMAALPGDLMDLDRQSGGKAIGIITAETLRFRRDMSVIPRQ